MEQRERTQSMSDLEIYINEVIDHIKKAVVVQEISTSEKRLGEDVVTFKLPYSVNYYVQVGAFCKMMERKIDTDLCAKLLIDEMKRVFLQKTILL